MEPACGASDSATGELMRSATKRSRCRRERSHDSRAIFIRIPRARTARADVFQALTFADCARQRHSTPAGDAVNSLVLANRHDAERSIVNWFTPRDLQ